MSIDSFTEITKPTLTYDSDKDGVWINGDTIFLPRNIVIAVFQLLAEMEGETE